MPIFSRRAVLMQLGASGLAALTPGAALAQNRYAELDTQPWSFLDGNEARFLASMADVLIPEDEFPSASQAGVVDFIDLQLAGPYGQGAGLYLEGPFEPGAPEQGWQSDHTPATLIRTGIERLEADDTRLVDLDAGQREEFVSRLSDGESFDLGDVPSKALFDEIWALVKEGYFSDPIYGGNKDYAGWEMVGFPGAHAYYTDHVDKNAPFRAPPRGIAHVPGTDRSADTARSLVNSNTQAAQEEG